MNFIVYIFGIPTSLTDRKVGWCVMLLIDIILKAQEGNNEASLILIGQFNPLLRKYAYKLSYAEVSLSSYDNYNILLTLSLNKILNQQEFLVIYTIYFLGYSSADIAQASGISRQAVNQTKVRALKKLRNALSV